MTNDHCLQVKDPETDLPVGRMKISCEATGVAKACIWHAANDSSCELSEPFCLNIQAVDTAMAAAGGCIPVKEHPNEKDSFARFTDFPPDFLWPECLVPPMSTATMLMVIMGGVATGLVVLSGLWFFCFALPAPTKQMPGKGKGKGKGFEAHPSGELDESGNPLPASLPGVPAMAEAPPPGGKPGMFPGGKPGMPPGGMKGMPPMDPNMMKGMPPGGKPGMPGMKGMPPMDPNMMKGMPPMGKGPPQFMGKGFPGK
jgi:hypothetical protein